mmetsp:Transcript_29107/g.66972  ORF Transcript_29107/g.66972 Transcript_29107/m.66972 type:complete len:399 (+) Transcript_29107:68-1264(+)
MLCFHWTTLFIWLGLAVGINTPREESRKQQVSIAEHSGLRNELQLRSETTDAWPGYGAELLKVDDHYSPPAYQLAHAESAHSVIAHRVHNMMANLQRMRAERRKNMEEAAAAFKESQEALREAKQAEQDVANADKALADIEEETQEAVVDTREVEEDLKEMASKEKAAAEHLEKAEKLVAGDPDAGMVDAPAPAPVEVAATAQADDESSEVRGLDTPVRNRERVKTHSVGAHEEEGVLEETAGWYWSSWTSLGPLWLRRVMGGFIVGALLLGCCVGCFACWRMENSYKKASELNTAASGVIAYQYVQQRAMERGDSRHRSYSRGENVSLASTPRGGNSASGHSAPRAPSRGPSSRPASVPASPVISLRGGSTPVQAVASYGGGSSVSAKSWNQRPVAG